MEPKEIVIMKSVYARNDEIACEINKNMTDRGIFVVNVMGTPGAGKTTALTRLIPLLQQHSTVIEGDIESDIDTVKLNSMGIQTMQINTNGACHLDSAQIAAVLDKLKPPPGFLFIENIGNLVCPAEFLIGEHIKLLISSITEGSDKPYKYPLAFEKADMILMNKCDLSEYLEFDEEYFISGVKKLNPLAPVFKVSGKTGFGFGEVAAWITARSKSVIGK